ncbi:hypothetical protein CAPTEDRAFT_211576 [Capitella teleta]|uniref:Uncharacterized protein n=1 Tax=Capitella teleta TaxID=283909 RepID=R7TNY2_CAPTE|nr:hypothetical protein CAPTEDRAFT_211576 [Capitella teleta]|eukprot:ELT95329.1 hypothetical protein CAPTEDRAFT_211576 [Capitella teleta]
MATGKSMIVEFMDEVPNDNFCTISLEIKGLKIHQAHWGAKSVMKNGRITVEEFKTRSILVKIEVEGEEYEYQRDLPVDIDPEQSKCKHRVGLYVIMSNYKLETDSLTTQPFTVDVKHPECVRLKICKRQKNPWVKYDMLFIGED